MEFRIDAEFLTTEDIELLKQLKNKSKKRLSWKPNLNDTYWFITNNDGSDFATWINSNADLFRWSMGNVYKTCKEAEFEIEKQKVTMELKRYAEEHNEEINWSKNDCCKWYLRYDYFISETQIVGTIAFKDNNIYFSSEKIAKNAINEIGEEKIVKYYLGIK